MKKTTDRNACVFAITSGKGGVGKSNIALNMGILLAAEKKKVCLFDADLNLANINVLLGKTPLYTLEHVILNNTAIEDIVFSSHQVDIIAGASGLAQFTSLKAKQQNILLESIKKLERHYDYLIIDTAAGIDNVVLQFLHASPIVFLVLTKEPASLTDAYSLVKVLIRQGFKGKLFVIVNQVENEKIAQHIYMRFNEAVYRYLKASISYAGYINYDEQIIESVLMQKPWTVSDSQSKASKRLKTILIRLMKFLQQSRLDIALFSQSFEHQLNPVSDNEHQQLTKTLSSLTESEVEFALKFLTDKKIKVLQQNSPMDRNKFQLIENNNLRSAQSLAHQLKF